MIRHALLIAKKELLSFFVSPVSYLVAGMFFFVYTLFFFLFLKEVRGEFEIITRLFFSWHHFWFLALFIPPIITMRLVSDEYRLGTIEMLMTAPSSDAGVILGKFLAAFGFSLLLWLPTPLLFIVASTSGATFDWGIVAAGYVGVAMVYGLFCAIGIFTSAITESPIFSMLLSLVIELALFFLMFFRSFSTASWAESVSNNYALYNIVENSLMKGIVNTVHLVFILSLIWLFLFLATRALEFRRWR
ncbi:MAG: ABC transporter permease [Planctomycetota bacterium]